MKFVYDQAIIHFGLIHVVIGDKSSKGAVVITNSVKIGVREIDIGSTHTFCTTCSLGSSVIIFSSFFFIFPFLSQKVNINRN